MPESREIQERLRQAIWQVIAQQVAANDPPETKETLQRLQREGYSEAEALELVGRVVSAEVIAVLREGRPYDAARYAARLKALPGLPPNHAS